MTLCNSLAAAVHDGKHYSSRSDRVKTWNLTFFSAFHCPCYSLCLLFIFTAWNFHFYAFRVTILNFSNGFEYFPPLNKTEGQQGDMFLIIYLTSEQQSKLNGLACCLFLLGSLKLHRFPHDIIFCPGLFLHGMRFFATVHANQKQWFMHRSCGEWNIKFNFAAIELRLQQAQAWHGEPRMLLPRGNSLLPPQYAKATYEWNICLMSDLSSVYSLYIDTWTLEEGGRRSYSTVTKQWVA